MRFCFGDSDSSSDVPPPEPIGAVPARTPVRDQFPEPKAWEPTLEEFLNIAPLESETCGAQLSSKKKNRRTKVVRRSWGGGPGDEGRGAFFDRSLSESQPSRSGDPPPAAAGEEGHGDGEVTSKSPFPMKTPTKSAARVSPANIQPSPPRSSVCLASVLSSSVASRFDTTTTSSTVAYRSSSASAQDAGEPRPSTASNGRGATVRVVSTAAAGGFSGGSSGTRLFASGGAAAGSYSSLSYTTSRGLASQLGMQRSVSTGCLVSFGRPAPASCVAGTVIGELTEVGPFRNVSPPALLPASLSGKS